MNMKKPTDAEIALYWKCMYISSVESWGDNKWHEEVSWAFRMSENLKEKYGYDNLQPKGYKSFK